MTNLQSKSILFKFEIPSNNIKMLQENPGRLTLLTELAVERIVVKLRAYSRVQELGNWYRGESLLRREWCIMKEFYELAVPVPRPIEFRQLPRRDALYSFRDAIIMEYLEDATPVCKHIHSLVDSGCAEELTLLEDNIITLTQRLLEAGYYDTDHSPHNMLLCNSALYRLDFGEARKSRRLWQPVNGFGEMLGHLIAMYTFVLQPEVDRVPLFARKLFSRLSPPAAVCQYAKRFFQYRMEKQRREKGIDTIVTLPEQV